MKRRKKPLRDKRGRFVKAKPPKRKRKPVRKPKRKPTLRQRLRLAIDDLHLSSLKESIDRVEQGKRTWRPQSLEEMRAEVQRLEGQGIPGNLTNAEFVELAEKYRLTERQLWDKYDEIYG